MSRWRILAHSPRGIPLNPESTREPSTPEVDDPAELPAMPHDAELELGQGQASLEHERRKTKRKKADK